MIALARTQPDYSTLLGHRLTVYESTEAGLLHWTGRLVGIDAEPNGETYWLLVDDAGVTFSIAWSDIRRIDYEDVLPEVRRV